MKERHLRLVSDNSSFVIQHIMDYLFHEEMNPMYWDERTGTWGDIESATRYGYAEKNSKSIRTKTGKIMPNVKNGDWVDLFEIERSKSSHPTNYKKRPTLTAIQAGPDQ